MQEKEEPVRRWDWGQIILFLVPFCVGAYLFIDWKCFSSSGHLSRQQKRQDTSVKQQLKYVLSNTCLIRIASVVTFLCLSLLIGGYFLSDKGNEMYIFISNLPIFISIVRKFVPPSNDSGR